jgi:hypothetical protein
LVVAAAVEMVMTMAAVAVAVVEWFYLELLGIHLLRQI